MTTLKYIATGLLGALLVWLAVPREIAPVRVDVQVPDQVRLHIPLADLAAAYTHPTPAAATAERKRDLRPGERLLVGVVRARVRGELERDGWKLIGGDGTAVDKARVTELLALVDDGQILAGAHSRGMLGDGTILERLGAVFDWILAHREEILELVKFVMTLLALFGET